MNAKENPTPWGEVRRAGSATGFQIVSHRQRRPRLKHPHRAPAVAARRWLSYPEHVAATSAAGFGSPKTTGAPRATRARFFVPEFMAGVVGSLRARRFPVGRSANPQHPPPFRLAANRWRSLQSLQEIAMSTKPTQGAPAPTAETLFREAFHPHRALRSEAYRQGCLAALRLGEAGHVESLYQPGTAEAEAFHAGAQEGHAIAREAVEEVHQ